MNKTSDSNKEMSKLFYNLYIGCVKYKVKNEEKNIKCDEFYDKFKFFSEKYADSKEQKNKEQKIY
jgi:hypothetical protein